jgi:hypothetical protein
MPAVADHRSHAGLGQVGQPIGDVCGRSRCRVVRAMPCAMREDPRLAGPRETSLLDDAIDALGMLVPIL